MESDSESITSLYDDPFTDDDECSVFDWKHPSHFCCVSCNFNYTFRFVKCIDGIVICKNCEKNYKN